LAESRNIGLDSVIAKQREDYEKYDFKFAYRNLRYAGSSSIIRTSTKPSKYVIDITHGKAHYFQTDQHLRLFAEDLDQIRSMINAATRKSLTAR
jgi:hypothetical protein